VKRASEVVSGLFFLFWMSNIISREYLKNLKMFPAFRFLSNVDFYSPLWYNFQSEILLERESFYE